MDIGIISGVLLLICFIIFWLYENVRFNLWSWKGQIESGKYYFIWGLMLFGTIYNLQRYVYYFFYKKFPWFWNLFYDYRALGYPASPYENINYIALTYLIASPLIYNQIVITVKRLRALQLPVWSAVLMLVPFINFLFFLLLSFLPSAKTHEKPIAGTTEVSKRIFNKIIPDSSLGSAIAAILLSSMIAFLGFLLSVYVFKSYGIALYVVGPLSLGLIAALLHGYHTPKSMNSCISIASLSVFVLAFMLLAFAFEGIICIFMAVPIGLVLAALGALLGYFIQRRPNSRNDIAKIVPILMIFVPLSMGAEYAIQPQPTVFAVKSFVDINAPDNVVWKNITASIVFPEPQDPLFKAGVVYPIRAEIIGHGVGAIRKCYCSTGTYIEPITTWDENRLLSFDDKVQPQTMKELSPYKNIHPPHLDHYLVTQKGQFLLIKLPDGKVRLEGTTWYYNKMWPESYWRVWSDYLIHKIHLHALKQIKNAAEAQASLRD